MGIHHWLQLSLTNGLGPVLIGRLIERCGSPEAATQATAADLRQIEGIGSAKASAIHQSLHAASADADIQLAKAMDLGATIFCAEDSTYPQLLKLVPSPPPVLYMLGALEPRDLQSLAIVGSRRCSYYGREQAERFAALLAGAGFTVISGGARGIDSAAHRGAMQHPAGRTIAVLGSGLDVPYPPENESLFQQIATRGAVLSEFPFGTPPNSENFPRRNRIVSGMSRGVLVIEADERSGALITARLANEDHGRPVFALPGRVDNRMSIGPHKLIRDGAVLTSCIEDIVQGLHPLPDSVAEPGLFESLDLKLDQPQSAGELPSHATVAAPPATLTDRQRQVFEHVGADAATVDQLIDRTGLDAQQVLQDLTFLSLKGLVRRIDGQTFARVAGRAR